MKKKLFSLLILSCFVVNAQDMHQAIRLSQTSFEGGARFTAMGGAFGAIGGELNGLVLNPAGSSIFAFSEAAMSLLSFSDVNKTNYFNTSNQEKNRNLGIHQAGIVLVLDNESNQDWSKLSIGFNYQRKANYHDHYALNGNNPNHGMDDYFIGYAQGLMLQNIQTYYDDGETFADAHLEIGNTFGLGYVGQQAHFGYDGFMISPIPFENTNDSEGTNDDITDPLISSYESNVLPGANGFEHYFERTSSGSQRKYTFNISSVYRNKLYLGVNINTYAVEYNEITTIRESGYDIQSIVQQLDFYNELSSIGTGSSFQLGAIYKVNDALRVGITLDSPIYYRLTDRVYQNMQTLVYDDQDQLGEVYLDPKDGFPNAETILPEYQFDSPGNVRLSMAYIFGDRGLISIDYNHKRYDSAQFTPRTNDYTEDLNQQIEDQFQATQLWQIGGEYRLDPHFSLRAGYVYESASRTNYDDSRQIISGGIGYNFGASNLDISMTASSLAQQYELFNVGLTDPYQLERDRLNVVISYRIKL